MLERAKFDGQAEFEEFTKRHSDMSFEKDTIIYEQNERQRKFDEWKQSHAGKGSSKFYRI